MPKKKRQNGKRQINHDEIKLLFQVLCAWCGTRTKVPFTIVIQKKKHSLVKNCNVRIVRSVRHSNFSFSSSLFFLSFFLSVSLNQVFFFKKQRKQSVEVARLAILLLRFFYTFHSLSLLQKIVGTENGTATSSVFLITAFTVVNSYKKFTVFEFEAIFFFVSFYFYCCCCCCNIFTSRVLSRKY